LPALVKAIVMPQITILIKSLSRRNLKQIPAAAATWCCILLQIELK